MRQVLATYKDRLVNISGRNRSLVLRKVYKKRSFDIVRAFAEQGVTADELVDFLVKDENRRTLIVDDPFKVRNELQKSTDRKLKADREEELASLTNVLKRQESITEEDESIIRKRRLEIDEKYDMLQSEEVRRINETYETLLMMSNNMNYLNRETLAIEKETGKYELYIGYPFVEGRFKDGGFVRAPFFLFPVELEMKNNKWYLRNNPSRDPMVNKVLLFAAAKSHQSQIKEYEPLDLKPSRRLASLRIL